MSLRLPTHARRLLAALTLSLIAGLAMAQSTSWKVTLDTLQGLPTVTKGGAPAIKSAFVFWGANWAWADTSTRFQVLAPYSYSLGGRNASLDFDMTGSAQHPAANQMTWNFDLNAAAAKTGIIGGGISFKFDLATFGPEMGPPAILPDKTGWTWGPAGGPRLEMRFSPAPANLYMEPVSKNEIRAFFYNGSMPAGHTVSTATLTLSGTDIAFVPTIIERFGFADPTTWPSNIMDWRTSPVDLSFLNQPEIPAGKHGFIKAAKDRFVFQDGTTTRFWGTNLAAYALFTTSKDGAKLQAHRLSQLGFNLVRIHHHDSYWVNPNVFGPTTAPNTLSLSAASMDKLDWWIKCLKDEGIYVWLDLHAQRFLKAGDQIDYFDEIAKGKTDADLKGYNYVNGSIQRAMRDFARAYTDHLNPYTNLRYKDDPAIAALLLTNENDLTHHYGNNLLPDKNVPQHDTLYMGEAAKFANTWGLNKDATWQSWVYGPSKLFLNDLEYRFDQAMIQDLRNNGVKVPIATTNSWAGMPMSSLPALTAGDIIDTHSYGNIGELEKHPLYAAHFLDWIAAAQVAGKPLTVTEWNVEAFPDPDRHVTPLFMAGTASLQGWDAIMVYAYSQAALDSQSVPSNWHAYSDPSMIATLPAAALLYRQGHVRESETVYAIAPTPAQLYNQPLSPLSSVALRTAVEKGKVIAVLPATKELPWLVKGTAPTNATVVTNLQQSFIPAGATSVTSDTGQLRRDWDQGTYTINTPRTQAVMGWIGGKTVQFPDISVAVSTRNATVAVQTLDGRAIATSRSMLVSLGARSIPAAGNRMPYYSEPVEGRVTIRSAAGLKLFKRRPDGTEQQLPVTYSNGAYVLNLDPSLQSYWLMLK
ncbi:MAG TPA: cellulase family glycosylhydrolase [Rhodocyclaceae bacterium]|nr:cellulase family glycosylhydrolase [Rhodocyclaceae bacterium]